jgi:hypothetical protein
LTYHDRAAASTGSRSEPSDPEEEYEVVGPVPTPTFLWLVADALEQHPCVVIEADMVDGLGNLVGSDLGAAARLRHLGNKLETLIFADDEGRDRAGVATNTMPKGDNAKPGLAAEVSDKAKKPRPS